MKKLEDIPKKEIYRVPESYFDSLPGKIQARIGHRQEQPSAFYRYRLQWVLPAIAMLVVAVIWFSPTAPADVEAMLASVESDQLIAFLGDADVTTDDLVEDIAFSAEEIESIEAESYGLGLEDADLEDVELNEIEF